MAETEDKPNVAVFPPLAFLVAIGLSLLLEWLAPARVLPPPFASALAWVPGLALIAAAVGLVLWAARTFKRAETNIDVRRPAMRLVESGPFRFTRNPMYLSMVTLTLGLGLAASLDWALPVAAALWATLHHGVVRREEAYLRAKFGAPYDAFLRRTRRWL